jgi:hypothetical protein
MWAAISLTPRWVRGGGHRHAHPQNQGGQRNQKNRHHQRTAGQFDDDIGEGQHQAGEGQHPDDDADDAEGGADLEAVFRA